MLRLTQDLGRGDGRFVLTLGHSSTYLKFTAKSKLHYIKIMIMLPQSNPGNTTR
jgi:translation initiation factor 2B subunit (eIF-2B alpha/beta/delta family)